MTIKKGDLEPALVIDIADSDDQADLNDVDTWRVIGRMVGSATLLFDDTSPDVVVGADAWTAAVTHEWVAGETNTVGTLRLEVEATWPGGRKQTFPSGDYLQVRIVEDLDL